MDRLRDDETGIEDLAPEDVGVDRPMPPTIQDVIATRLGRRELVPEGFPKRDHRSVFRKLETTYRTSSSTCANGTPTDWDGFLT